ncbi:DUF86 domain-containing protein [Microbacterium sp. STN6]|uniref:HepT-like ribonuclease domain-containing protein n=1 Tax=Microbacterium sp. STN6 TaxID=2995588 RepID=UPI002260B16D|nr:HepT-like ribonuclease domain-containing protein [Microbacterium sp. STN6]MCX7523436.1 DUF86 domain-containing protein [Microbacterium sp. STN6]
MKRSDEELVRDALEHIAKLRRHLSRSSLDDETVADAVSLRLAAAIESVSETSDEFRKRTFGSDWKIIWATRNRIAHGYAYIDLAIIRDTVEQDLLEFERRLTDAIN